MENLTSNQHKFRLSRKYTFWLTTDVDTTEKFEDCLQPIASFDTVEDFWGIYNYLKRPEDISTKYDYSLFIDGVKPMWEDEKNKHGGRWILRVKKEYGSRIWEEVILGLIGNQFDSSNEICGAMYLKKPLFDSISIWNIHGYSKAVQDDIREKIVSVLELPNEADIFYQIHPNDKCKNNPFSIFSEDFLTKAEDNLFFPTQSLTVKS